MNRYCCNPGHPEQSPVTASYALELREGRVHFLCELCARILDYIDHLDVFIEPIEEWQQSRLSKAQLLELEAAEQGDYLYDQSIST